MTKNQLIIATRESPLALWQANWVKQRLEIIHPNLSVSLLGITTQADKLLETPLYQVGGKALFVKELEEALLTGHADIAVHSMKDVPMELPTGLCLKVMCEREEPQDVLVSNQFVSVAELPLHAKVGTSSLRRQSQLLALRPDLDLVNLRGNVNTRLQKLDRGDFTAIILAAAGLIRLGLEQRISSYLNFVPAVGQGVLGIECRENDERIQNLIQPLDDATTHVCVAAERVMCTRLGGGCHAPVASFAEMKLNQIELTGLVASIDGARVLKVKQTGSDPDALGNQVANELIRLGAREILEAISR
jgi:hydroxymethylbilane synthase